MSKIPFEGHKVPESHAAREAAEKVAKLEEATKRMDDTTKKSIDDLLGATRKAKGLKPAARIETFEERVARLEREKKWEAERAERDRKWHEEWEARRKAEEAAAALRAEEEAKRRAKERLEREEAERVRLEKERYGAVFEKLVQPPQIYQKHEISAQVAFVSVNSAKACIVVRGHQCMELVNQITREIPADRRTWNGIDQVWEFHPSVMPQVKAILKTFYKDVQVLGVPKAIPSTKFDQLMAKLDKEDRDKIYKQLALKYHPDRGGSKEVMTLINLVFKEK